LYFYAALGQDKAELLAGAEDVAEARSGDDFLEGQNERESGRSSQLMRAPCRRAAEARREQQPMTANNS